MTPPIQLYVTLVILGILLIGAEVFLPGGVLGVIGALALFAACLTGFVAFGSNGGFLSSLGIIVFGAVCIGIWIKYFPQTPMGRRLTLSKSEKDFKPADDQETLLGRTGVAVSILRPSGIAKFDGKRVDVVADGDWIEEGKAIRVIEVEGFRVLVREAEEAQESA